MAAIVQLIGDAGTYGSEAKRLAQFFPPAPQWIDQVELDGSNPASYTIPTGASYLVINCTVATYYVSTGTAAVPAAGITNGTGSMLGVTQIDVRDTNVTALSFIAGSSGYVTISVYK